MSHTITEFALNTLVRGTPLHRIITTAGVVALVALATNAPAAVADGLNPNLMRDAGVMCDVGDSIDRDAGPMIGVFNQFGAQYVADTIHAVCPRNDMKVMAALMGAEQLGLTIRR